ncbi:hypothetical protein JL721_258 [Aureococcus anophagefferens]|nr:hypothetical protein JL721_258 [Aureococcus anophagefferens]
MGAGASLTFGGGTLSELDAKQQIGVCYDLDAEAVFHTYAVSDDGVLVVPYERCAAFAAQTKLLDGRVLFWNLAQLKRARAGLEEAYAACCPRHLCGAVEETRPASPERDQRSPRSPRRAAFVDEGPRQRAATGGVATTWDQVAFVAGFARALEAKVSRALTACGVDGASFRCAALKGGERARRKAEADYRGCVCDLLDVARGEVVCDDEAAMVAAVAALRGAADVAVARVKNFAPARSSTATAACSSPSRAAYEFFRPYFRAPRAAAERRLDALLALPVEAAGSVGDLVDRLLEEETDVDRLRDVVALLEMLDELACALRVRERVLELLRAGGGDARKLEDAALGIAGELEKLGFSYALRRAYADAAPLVARAVAIKEAHRGAFDVTVAAPALQLSGIRYEQGRYGDSEDLARRALRIYEDEYGGDHAFAIPALRRLALALERRATYAEAADVAGRLLASQERQLGKWHLDVAATLELLSTLEATMGRHEAAVPRAERELALKEKVLGGDHPTTAACRLRAATLAMAAGGRDGDAATSLERAARDLEDGLGAGRARRRRARRARRAPRAGRALGGRRGVPRARARRARGALRPGVAARRGPARVARGRALPPRRRPPAGRAALRAAPRAREARLRPSHPRLDVPLMNVAAAYEDLRRYDDAERLYRRALALREARAGGAPSPDVASALNGVAAALRCRGRLDDAEALFARSLAITAAANAAEDVSPGAASPRSAVAAPLRGLAANLADRGAYGDAEALLRRALKFDEMEHGADHPDTVPALSALVDALLDRARYRDAEPYAQRILAIRERRAPGSRDVAVALNRLAVVLKLQRKHDAADALYARCCDILEARVGAASPAYAAAVANRASLKRATGDFDGAGALYGEALRIFVDALGEDHPNVAVTRRHLADNAKLRTGLTPRSRRASPAASIGRA